MVNKRWGSKRRIQQLTVFPATRGLWSLFKSDYDACGNPRSVLPVRCGAVAVKVRSQQVDLNQPQSKVATNIQVQPSAQCKSEGCASHSLCANRGEATKMHTAKKRLRKWRDSTIVAKGDLRTKQKCSLRRAVGQQTRSKRRVVNTKFPNYSEPRFRVHRDGTNPSVTAETLSQDGGTKVRVTAE